MENAGCSRALGECGKIVNNTKHLASQQVLELMMTNSPKRPVVYTVTLRFTYELNNRTTQQPQLGPTAF